MALVPYRRVAIVVCPQFPGAGQDVRKSGGRPLRPQCRRRQIQPLRLFKPLVEELAKRGFNTFSTAVAKLVDEIPQSVVCWPRGSVKRARRLALSSGGRILAKGDP